MRAIWLKNTKIAGMKVKIEKCPFTGPAVISINLLQFEVQYRGTYFNHQETLIQLFY